MNVRPLRVAVLIDLERRPDSGGHVKTWEHLAEAAAGLEGVLDLTVHFSGEAHDDHVVAPNVRYLMHRRVLSTKRLPFLKRVPDHSDLSPWQPRLARALDDADVIHTTDGFFAFAHTAVKVAKKRGVPLVTSVHTDVPGYTRVFARVTIRRMLGDGWLAELLCDKLRIPGRAGRSMRHRLEHHLDHCAFVLVSREEDRRLAAAHVDEDKVGWLRRGIDKDVFSPHRRDRGWLAEWLAIPDDRVVVLTIGRLDPIKRTTLIAKAVERLVRDGLPVHLVCAGEGPLRDDVLARLGERASCPGFVAPHELGRLCASADLLAHAGTAETYANVVAEALSAGLPAVVSADGTTIPANPNSDLRVAEPRVDAWVEALLPLVTDRARRRAMAAAARTRAERDFPSWRQVLIEDALATWQRVAGRDAADTARIDALGA